MSRVPMLVGLGPQRGTCHGMAPVTADMVRGEAQVLHEEKEFNEKEKGQ